MRLPPRARSGRGGPGGTYFLPAGTGVRVALSGKRDALGSSPCPGAAQQRGDTDARLNRGIRTPPGAWLQVDVDFSLEEVPKTHRFSAPHRVLPSVTGGGFWRRCDWWVRSGSWGNKCHGFVVLQSQNPSWEATTDIHQPAC
ncbi:histone H2A deubiquitinase MYSM1 [Platysternon megacephalum]|uniref:Histone H2A deubiquitinase MYSM1 n=1 Tax=Platysternon megacephalum TaxID=55544 RepID=A0A4D9ETZ3_9SAUR|nr:histone H2A deubiquitinase MYSM1 [Platysternon megacephalum]